MDGFPRLEIEALGYHVETHGQKGFNGVAILSKQSPDEVNRGLPGDNEDEQARFIEAVFSVDGGSPRVASIYLPNGNPVDTPKYPYKLSWMARLEAFAAERLAARGAAGAGRRLTMSFPNRWIAMTRKGLGGRRPCFFPAKPVRHSADSENLGFTVHVRAVQ